MRFRILTLAVLAAVGFGLAGPAAAGPIVTIDDRLAALSTHVPGFGGLYVDDEGRLNVFLQDVREVAPFLAIDPDVRVHQADFSFARLHEWRLASRAGVLAQDSVVFLDVDDTRNRLQIGVDRSAGRQAVVGVLGALREAGVPRDAVVIEQTDPIYFVATLRDKIRPVPGGVQIRFSNFLCTLGFNAFRGGISGFVTNSHCTDQQGSNSGTEYFQPLNQVADEFIGVEQVDPSYFRNEQGCPRGARCRFSDSAWASYDSSTLSAGDEIARTDGVNTGSITIDPNSPRFFITAKDTGGNQAVGTTVNKIGRTTGWTRGDVTDSCVDTRVAGSNFVLLCQDFVAAGVDSGDSGSNVFIQTGTDSVTLVGILWGGTSDGSTFVYSPYSAIQSELSLD